MTDVPLAFTGVLDYRHPPRRAPSNWSTVAGPVEPSHDATFSAGPMAVAGAHALPQEALALGVVVCLDGYLDNRESLAQRLGLSARASCATVIATAYRRWSFDAVQELRGDFALLVWDRDRREGFVACDHFGVRSVFVSMTASRLHFASDLQPLLDALPSLPEPDDAALLQYVSAHPPGDGRTLYDGVVQLLPAHAMKFSGASWHSYRYWTPSYRGTLDEPLVDLTERVQGAIRAAVERRLAPSGTTAVTMSGGLDSTAVAAVAQGLAPGSTTAYSIAMPEFPHEDESTYIDAMAIGTGIPVKKLSMPASGLVAGGLSHIEDFGLPADSTTDFLRRPLLHQASADGVKMVLGGDGGDEVFGVRSEFLADLIARGRLRDALGLAQHHPDPGPPPPRLRLIRPLLRFTLDTYRPPRLDDLALRRRGACGFGPPGLLPDAATKLFDARPSASWKDVDGPRWWARLADNITRNHARLRLYDGHRRAAQSQGLDQRHPLLDYDLVDLALQLPPRLSFGRRLNRPQLRDAVKGIVPEAVRLREDKSDFVPIALVALVREKDVVTDVLSRPDAEITRLVDPTWLKGLIAGDHSGGRLNKAWLDSVWRLFMAECWLRELGDPGFCSALRDRTTSGSETSHGHVAASTTRPF